MEIQSFCHIADDFKGIMRCLVESLMVETALLAHKSLLLLLLRIGSLPDDHDIFQNSVRTYQRFPMSELNKVKEPDAENNDAGETEDDDDDDDDDDDEDSDDDDEDEDDGNDSEEESDDDEEDSDDEVEVKAKGNGESDDDDNDDDNDDDDDDDEDDEDDDDDDDDDDEEDHYQLPSTRKK